MKRYYKIHNREITETGLTLTHYHTFMDGFNTLRAALDKQAEQLDSYVKGHRYESEIREKIASLTKVDGQDLDAEVPLVVINERVPRGTDIEWAIATIIKQKEGV